MADFEVDDRGLDMFRDNLTRFEQDFPKESRVMLRKSGNRVKAIILSKAKEMVGKDKGNYYKSIKRGKIYKDNKTGGNLTVRVFPSSKIAPHAFLLEYGHRIVGHKPDNKEYGFQPGYHVFDKAASEVEREYLSIVASEFSKILDKL